MNDKDSKELIKQLQRINKNLERLTEAVDSANKNYIYTTNTTTTAAPPYYGAKVDTTGYASFGAEWTNKDSLEALK